MVVSVSELVNKLNMHRAFLRRILQVLSRHKILKSLKGKGGGFVLNMHPSKLRIIDIIEVFRGKTDIMDCLLEEDVCPYPDDCVLMEKMKDIEKKLYKTLKTTTIATLLKNIKGS
jgi:Rrf2 family protein